MANIGWSSTAMAKRYQHVVDAIRRGVADQVGELLWEADGPHAQPGEEAGGDDDQGPPSAA